MFIYKSHTGVLFTSAHELNHDELYCKQCEESDVLIGSAGTKKRHGMFCRITVIQKIAKIMELYILICRMMQPQTHCLDIG